MKNRIILKLFILLFLFILSSRLEAQTTAGLKFGVGLSRLTSRGYFNVIYKSQRFPVMPSINFGGYLSIASSKNSKINLELLINQVEGKEKSRIYVYPNTIYSGIDYLRIRRDLTYIGIPINFQYKINKLYYILGFDFRYSLLAREKSKETLNENSDFEQFDIYRFNIRSRVARIDYGIQIGVSYPLTKKSVLEIISYYGLNNIYSYNGHPKNQPDHPGVWKIQQLMVAYKYVLKNR